MQAGVAEREAPVAMPLDPEQRVEHGRRRANGNVELVETLAAAVALEPEHTEATRLHHAA
jgi:hypothetical protein